MNPTTSSLSWNRSKKTTLFERVFGSEDAEKRAALEREVYDLNSQQFLLGKRISKGQSRIDMMKEKRERLIEKGNSDPTLRPSLVGEIARLELEIKNAQNSQNVYVKMQSKTIQALCLASSELDIVKGVLPSANDLSQLDEAIEQRLMKKGMWIESLNNLIDVTPYTETQVNLPVSDAFTEGIWSIWEKGDQQRLAEEEGEKIKHENEVMSTRF